MIPSSTLRLVRPTIHPQVPFRRSADLLLRRGNSTIPPNRANNLTWPEYLAIRGSKRKWELAATVPSVFIGFGAGVLYFGSQEIDATKLIFSLDPIYVYGFATLACGSLGYLLGPVIGSSIWRLTHRKNLLMIEARDREFHKRIVKNRVDPTAQSPTNPVPDFYGEKIGSLHQYRQWLRDQAKYKKKAKWLED